MKFSFQSRVFKERVKSFFDRDKEKIEITPDRDWMVIMGGTVFFVIAFALVGYLFSLRVENDGKPAVVKKDEDDVAFVFDAKILQKTTDAFEKKKEERELFLKTPPTIPSP